MTDMLVQNFDGCIDQDTRESVWNYIQNQSWHVAWKPINTNHKHYDYVPNKTKGWQRMDPQWQPNMFMPRAVFASDEYNLREDHPIIYNLWKKINTVLNDEFEIAGAPEKMPMDFINKWPAPLPKDESLQPGWRVYANSQPNEHIKRTHGIHRDSTDLNDKNNFTLLYVANLEWYPSWFGECVFYPNDNEGLTGDYQQYQKGNGQSREFPIGWLDEGKVISPVPGRIILYDSRTLHTTKPPAIWAEEDRKVIAFRLRKK